MTIEEAKSITYGDEIVALRSDEKVGITVNKTYIAVGSNYFPNIQEVVITHFNDRDPSEKSISTLEDIPTWCSNYRLFRKV